MHHGRVGRRLGSSLPVFAMFTSYARCAQIKIQSDHLEQVRARFVPGFQRRRARPDFAEQVVDLLDLAGRTHVGRDLLASLAKHGHQVQIRPPEMRLAAGTSSEAGFGGRGSAFQRPLGQPHGWAQLCDAWQRSGLGSREIADLIEGWSAEAGARVPATSTSVAAWLTDSARDRPEEGSRAFRYVVLALEPWLDRGEGAGAVIRFDPNDEPPGNVGADVVLVHELVHAWYIVSGRQIFGDEHLEHGLMVIGINGFERRASGHTRRYTENRYRSERGLPLRQAC
jgi:hypothetical protein